LLRHAGTRSTLPWISPEALEILADHDWPGNVRELENVLQRALLLAPGDVITAEHLIFDRRPEMRQERPETLSNIVQMHEFQAIRETLAECNGSRIETAKRLGISERTLRYRLAKAREQGEDIAQAISA
jgi:two-component system response regulator FlrC